MRFKNSMSKINKLFLPIFIGYIIMGFLVVVFINSFLYYDGCGACNISDIFMWPYLIYYESLY